MLDLHPHVAKSFAFLLGRVEMCAQQRNSLQWSSGARGVDGDDVVEELIRLKARTSPEYAGYTHEDAEADFRPWQRMPTGCGSMIKIAVVIYYVFFYLTKPHFGTLLTSP